MRQAGFTLLEILVAVVIFSLVLVGLAGGVDFGLRASTIQAQKIASDADLGSADRLLRRLVAGMDPGTLTEPPGITGGLASLGFITDAGLQATATGGDELQVGLGVDASHQLVLRWTPFRHAIDLGKPPTPAISVLVPGVQQVQFAYWGHGGGGAGAWLPQWTEKGIPPLVRIRLTLPVASHLAWPDIIIATQRRPRNG